MTIYKVVAYWPNAVTEPLVGQFATLDAATAEAFSLRDSQHYTTISVIVADISLELVRLWGQPPAVGKWWP